MVDKRHLDDLDLSDYSHIVLVGGNHGDLSGQTDKIDNWVRQGGTLVGIRQGARWAFDNILFSDASPDEGGVKVNVEVDVEAKTAMEVQAERFDYADKDEIEAQGIIGGAIMLGDLDNTHPIGFGIHDRAIASHRNILIAFYPPENPWASLIRIPDNSLLSGFASAENQAALAGKAMAVAERHGSGSVIAFADNPNFRAYFFDTNKLFMNSLFFSLAFDRPR